jgi:adenylosuccinate lyase
VRIEIAWLVALSEEPAIAEVAPFARMRAPRSMRRGVVLAVDAARVKAIERTTNHDVKAVEYWLRERFAGVAEIARVAEFIHFAMHVRGHQQPRARHHARRGENGRSCCRRCAASQLRSRARARARRGADARAHARPAGDADDARQGDRQRLRALERQIAVDRARAAQGQGERRRRQLQRARRAYPTSTGSGSRAKVVAVLGLEFNPYTTQIEPHDYMASSSTRSRARTPF